MMSCTDSNNRGGIDRRETVYSGLSLLIKGGMGLIYSHPSVQ